MTPWSGAQKRQRPTRILKCRAPESEYGDRPDRHAISRPSETADFLDRMLARGFLELKDGKQHLTDAGKAAGRELRMSPRFGA